MVAKTGSHGFTLIELMIVVAVLAVLAAIAYPSYQSHIKKTKRVEVQAHMMQLAQNLENYKLVNLSYAGASLSNWVGDQFPTTGTAHYQLTLTNADGIMLTMANAENQSWLLVARPISTSGQKNTGAISIDSSQTRCWYKDNDSAKVVVETDETGQSIPLSQCTETW